MSTVWNHIRRLSGRKEFRADGRTGLCIHLGFYRDCLQFYALLRRYEPVQRQRWCCHFMRDCVDRNGFQLNFVSRSRLAHIFLLLAAYFFIVMVVRYEFDPKILRDLLIPFVFFFMGSYLGSYAWPTGW